MLDDVKAQALTLGADLSRLRVLHITTPFNLSARYKVDVKSGVLVELRPPIRTLGSRAASPKKKR